MNTVQRGEGGENELWLGPDKWTKCESALKDRVGDLVQKKNVVMLF